MYMGLRGDKIALLDTCLCDYLTSHLPEANLALILTH